MPTSETAVCQTLDAGRWTDYGRTTPEEAAAWVGRKPAERRAVDWESGDVLPA